MIQIVVPMAGLGSRFKSAGYDLPKPFIDVAGKPMIMRVLENLYVPNAEFILVHQKDHSSYFDRFASHLRSQFPVRFFSIEGLTQGSACTVLCTHRLINNSNPLIIANSDQFIEGGIENFVQDAQAKEWDGSILTFIDEKRDPKWSFVETNSKKEVIRSVEKVVISDRATVGVYFFKQGKYFVESALDMILAQDMSRNEYYTCPTYNYMYKNQLRTGFFDIPFSTMHGLGTPEDLQLFLDKFYRN